MRTWRMVAIPIVSAAAVFAFPGSAWATNYQYPDPAGDVVKWDSEYNILTVCDNSPANGTAEGVLSVIGGGTWQLFDSDGDNGQCVHSNRLSTDASKKAYLTICASAYGPCASRPDPVDL